MPGSALSSVIGLFSALVVSVVLTIMPNTGSEVIPPDIVGVLVVLVELTVGLLPNTGAGMVPQNIEEAPVIAVVLTILPYTGAELIPPDIADVLPVVLPPNVGAADVAVQPKVLNGFTGPVSLAVPAALSFLEENNAPSGLGLVPFTEAVTGVIVVTTTVCVTFDPTRVWSDFAGVCLVYASLFPNNITAGDGLSVVTACV